MKRDIFLGKQFSLIKRPIPSLAACSRSPSRVRLVPFPRLSDTAREDKRPCLQCVDVESPSVEAEFTYAWCIDGNELVTGRFSVALSHALDAVEACPIRSDRVQKPPGRDSADLSPQREPSAAICQSYWQLPLYELSVVPPPPPRVASATTPTTATTAPTACATWTRCRHFSRSSLLSHQLAHPDNDATSAKSTAFFKARFLLSS
ncbi:hypothetical protein AWB67_07011 [Caballeronia terrestris]|uniref:Uncharacterized protein n=1 Tax=Caballeronia terrestris TaxID=1226301 RepID=A0A158KX58_9BURK|nr:hypothetical protein AWB67_07011 [Caballeronia terrestris]